MISNSSKNSDLGTGFKNLVYLWMARCHVRELDGISSFIHLKEVYLAYNNISDISDLSRLENLEIVDLERYEFAISSRLILDIISLEMIFQMLIK